MDGTLELHHVAFRARDLEATVAFYKEVFGLSEVRSARPASVWLGIGDAVLMVEARASDEPLCGSGSQAMLHTREYVPVRVEESEGLIGMTPRRPAARPAMARL